MYFVATPLCWGANGQLDWEQRLERQGTAVSTTGELGMKAWEESSRCSHPTLLGCGRRAWLGVVGGMAGDCRFYNRRAWYESVGGK